MVCHTLSLHRQVWTPKIRSHVKSVLFRCVTCKKLKAKVVARPLPPSLPHEQVSWVAPFSATGVDHRGHISYRNLSGQWQKLYICLFVCTMTQAVHLEVIDNLSMPSFILCLRRVAAAKGLPSLILSDDHWTFVSGEKIILELHEDQAVQKYLTERRIVWKHQTPLAPWSGGHFERLVRIVKTSLTAATSKKLFNWEEFVAIPKEVETIVNCCPLTYQGIVTQDIPLSPSQLEWGQDLIFFHLLLLPKQLDNENYYEAKAARHQYYLISSALDHFWQWWVNEYLTALWEKHLNCCADDSSHHIKMGALVMVKQSNLHRHEWPMGRKSLGFFLMHVESSGHWRWRWGEAISSVPYRS